MRIALLMPDNRENFRQYDRSEPYFGTAPSALLKGFAMLGTAPSDSELKNLEIHVISCTQKIMPAPEKLASNIWFHQLHVPKWGWLRSSYLGCAFSVRRKLEEIQPGLVHAQGTERDCAVSAVLAPYPRLLTIHGNLRLIKKQIGFKPFSAMWLQSYVEGFVVPRFDGIVCITNYTKATVKNEVPTTWVVPNAVDPSFLEIGMKRLNQGAEAGFQQSQALKIATYESKGPQALSPIILIVGTIDHRKNQNFLIKALDPLSEKCCFELRFFGSCCDDKYSQEFLSLVTVRPWCYYGGMIGREELRNEFSEAAILILPTHEDNCPMVVLEAQAAGLPVIASKVGGVPDLIEDRETGLFVDPSDSTSMMNAIELLLNDEKLRFILARKAYDHALRSYHPKTVAERHVEIYNEVLEGRGKNPS